MNIRRNTLAKLGFVCGAVLMLASHIILEQQIDAYTDKKEDLTARQLQVISDLNVHNREAEFILRLMDMKGLSALETDRLTQEVDNSLNGHEILKRELENINLQVNQFNSVSEKFYTNQMLNVAIMIIGAGLCIISGGKV